jgi:hypothetical protein
MTYFDWIWIFAPFFILLLAVLCALLYVGGQLRRIADALTDSSDWGLTARVGSAVYNSISTALFEAWQRK